MNYLLLTTDMTMENVVPQFREVKEFNLHRFRMPKVEDNYYVKQDFGLYTGDGEKALSHTVKMLRILGGEYRSKGLHCDYYVNELFADMNRVLKTCIGDVDHTDEVFQIVFEALAQMDFLERVPEFVESYYNDYYLDMAKDRYEPLALDYYDLYTRIGDYELFSRGNVQRALQFYYLADIDWLLLRDDTVRDIFEISDREKYQRKSWHETVLYLDKIFAGSITREELLSESRMENAFWEEYCSFQEAKVQRDMYRIAEMAENCIRIGLEILTENKEQAQEHRDILLAMYGIRRDSIFQTICVLGKDAEVKKKKFYDRVIEVISSFYTGKQGLLGAYAREHRAEKMLDKIIYLLCEVVQLVDKVKATLLVQKIDQDMAYYTAVRTMMYLMPEKAQDNLYGKLSVMHIAYMNDPNEGKILDKYLFGEQVLTGRESSRRSAEFPFVFMKCFTSLVDDLPMWEMYGDHAQGCCLVLDWARTMSSLPKKDAVPLYRICYVKRNKRGDAYSINNEDNAKIPDLKNFKKAMGRLAEIAKEFKSNPSVERLFTGLIEDITYLFKNSDYSHEQEMRILYHKEPKDGAIWHTEGEFPMLYVLTEFNICIKEIIFGPKCPDMTRRLPYIQEKLHEMCQKTGMTMPKLTVSAIEYM